jgi:hypothetical protein
MLNLRDFAIVGDLTRRKFAKWLILGALQAAGEINQRKEVQSKRVKTHHIRLLGIF